MTKTKWCVIQKTKTKSKFAVKINTARSVGEIIDITATGSLRLSFHRSYMVNQPKKPPTRVPWTLPDALTMSDS